MEVSECQTEDDIIKFLVSKLTWIPDPPVQKGWRQQFGYRQAYFIQQVWYHPDTKRYAFHSDEYDNWNPDSPPNLGMYESFETMLTGVAKRYAALWATRNSPRVQ